MRLTPVSSVSVKQIGTIYLDFRRHQHIHQLPGDAEFIHCSQRLGAETVGFGIAGECDFTGDRLRFGRRSR